MPAASNTIWRSWHSVHRAATRARRGPSGSSAARVGAEIATGVESATIAPKKALTRLIRKNSVVPRLYVRKLRREGAFQAGANCHGGAAPSTRMPTKIGPGMIGLDCHLAICLL